MCNGDGSSPYYKSEIPYNPVTWAEWILSRTTMSNNELVFTPDGIRNRYATYNTSLKPLTKYGVLLNVTQKGSSYFEIDFGTALGAGGFYKNLSLENNKIIGTTPAVISNNSFMVYQAMFPIGQICKTKDIRVFELPTGSQIEADFTNLTADELSAKYTFNGLCEKYWKRLVGTEAEIQSSLTNVMPTQSYEGFTPYKMIYELAEPIVTYINPTTVNLNDGTTYIETDSHLDPNVLVGYKVKDGYAVETDITAPEVDYPSEVRNTGDTGSFDLISTNGIETSTYTFPYILRATPNVADRIVVDNEKKIAKIVRDAMLKKINWLNGTKNWMKNFDSGDYISFYLTKNIFNSIPPISFKINENSDTDVQICSHFIFSLWSPQLETTGGVRQLLLVFVYIRILLFHLDIMI